MKVAGLFIDIQKAFNTVDHSILFERLWSAGMRGLPHNCFSSYLSRRTHRIRVNGVLGRSREIKYGVPQGYVLGVILFLYM